MMTKIALTLSFLCATSAVADIIQQDTTGCGQLNSSDMTCTYYAPSFFWPATHAKGATSFSWSGSQRDTRLLALDTGSSIFNSKGTLVGPVTADIKELPAVRSADYRQTFSLANSPTNGPTAAGTTFGIDRPLDFVFRIRSGETADWKPAFAQQSSDSVPVTVVPKFDQPRASEVPEQGTWSELLSISLGGAIIVGLTTLFDRRILP